MTNLQLLSGWFITNIGTNTKFYLVKWTFLSFERISDVIFVLVILITFEFCEYGFWFYLSFALNALKAHLDLKTKTLPPNGSETFKNVQSEMRRKQTTKLIYIPMLWFIFFLCVCVYFTPSDLVKQKFRKLCHCQHVIETWHILSSLLTSAHTENYSNANVKYVYIYLSAGQR